MESDPETEALARPGAFGLGATLATTFRIWWRELGTLAGITLILESPVLLGTAALGFELEGAPDDPRRGLLGILSNLLWIAVTGAVTLCVLEALQGRRSTLRQLLSGSLLRARKVFVVGLLYGGALVLGLVMLVLPGFMALAGFFVATPAVIAEPGLDASGSLGRSWQLTSGHRLAVLGLGAVVWGVTLLLFLVTGAVVELAGGYAFGPLAAVHDGLLDVILTLVPAAAAVAYHDLRLEKEGPATEQLGQVFE